MPAFVLLAILAALLAIYFLFSIIFVNIYRKDLSFLKTPLSKYAFGQKGYLLTMGFMLVGFSELLTSYLLRPQQLLVSQYLALTGIGVIIVGTIKMDDVNKKSLQNRTHNFGVMLQFLCYPVAVFLYGLAINAPIIKIYSLATGLATFFLFIIIYALYPRYVRGQVKYYGLIQKINILLTNLWLIVVPISMLL